MSRVPRSRSSALVATATVWSPPGSSTRFATAPPSSCLSSSTSSRGCPQAAAARPFCGAITESSLRTYATVVSAPLPTPSGQDDESTPAHARAPMSSMPRPRYVFDIDRHQYPRCGAALRVLAVIADPPVIATMLEHIDTRAAHRFFPLTHPNCTPVHSAVVAATSALGHLVNRSARPPPPCQQTPSSRVSHRRYRAHRRPPSIPHDSHTDLRDTAHRRRYVPLEFRLPIPVRRPFTTFTRYVAGSHSPYTRNYRYRPCA